MTTKSTKKADIEKKISQIYRPYPLNKYYGEMLDVEDVIQKIAEEYEVNNVSGMLINFGMIDDKMRPSDVMLKYGFAIQPNFLDDDPRSKEPEGEFFYITPLGHEFWKELIEQELVAEQKHSSEDAI